MQIIKFYPNLEEPLRACSEASTIYNKIPHLHAHAQRLVLSITKFPTLNWTFMWFKNTHILYL